MYSVPVVKQIIKYPSNKETSFGQEYFVLAPGKETSPKVSIVLSGVDVYDSIAGVNNSEFIRISATQSNFLVEKNLKLEMQRCYPGFLFDGNTCVCDLRIFGIERYVEGYYIELYWILIPKRKPKAISIENSYRSTGKMIHSLYL